MPLIKLSSDVWRTGEGHNYYESFHSSISLFFTARLLRSAKWRRDPATDGQKLLLAKRLRLGESSPVPSAFADENDISPSSSMIVPRSKISLETLTKGQAANIINRLQHGAARYYDSKTKERVKAAHAAAKLEKIKKKETVRVGPLLVD